MELKYELELEHTTKGAVCYKEMNGGRHSFYLRKEEVPKDIPEKITITVNG